MKPTKTGKSSSQVKTGSRQHPASQVKTAPHQASSAKPKSDGKPSGSNQQWHGKPHNR